METKSSAELRSAGRRRMLRWVAAVATAVVVVGVAVAVRAKTESLKTTASGVPGFADANRPIDTTPFTLAGPSGTRASTIPGDLGPSAIPEGLVPPITSATVPPTTDPPTTTTTTLPASHPDVICDGFIDLFQLIRVARDRPGTLRPDEVAATVADLARRLERIGEPSYEPAIARLDEAAARLEAASSDVELRETFREMIGSDLQQEPLSRHAQDVCPEILAAG